MNCRRADLGDTGTPHSTPSHAALREPARTLRTTRTDVRPADARRPDRTVPLAGPAPEGAAPVSFCFVRARSHLRTRKELHPWTRSSPKPPSKLRTMSVSWFDVLVEAPEFDAGFPKPRVESQRVDAGQLPVLVFVPQVDAVHDRELGLDLLLELRH